MALPYSLDRENELSLSLNRSIRVAPFLFRRLEIAVFRVGKDEVKSQEPRLDVIEFVLPAIAEMGLANRFINPTGTEVVDEAPPRVSLGRGMAQGK